MQRARTGAAEDLAGLEMDQATTASRGQPWKSKWTRNNTWKGLKRTGWDLFNEYHVLLGNGSKTHMIVSNCIFAKSSVLWFPGSCSAAVSFEEVEELWLEKQHFQSEIHNLEARCGLGLACGERVRFFVIHLRYFAAHPHWQITD